VPLFAFGVIPFVGPGGMFIAYTHNLFHIIAVLIMVTPISTWFVSFWITLLELNSDPILDRARVLSMFKRYNY